VIVLIEGLALTLLILLAVQVVASWRARRDERRERLLAESWAIYRTSRQIHDMTTRALQALLDEARAGRSERP
jgi:hypothetical protein